MCSHLSYTYYAPCLKGSAESKVGMGNIHNSFKIIINFYRLVFNHSELLRSFPRMKGNLVILVKSLCKFNMYCALFTVTITFK